MSEYEKHMIRRMVELGVQVDTINKIKNTDDVLVKEECIRFINNADMNPQMEINASDVEGFIQALNLTIKQGKDPLIKRVTDYSRIKKNYNTSDTEFCIFIKQSKNETEFLKTINKDFDFKKEEKMNECIERGLDEDQLDFLSKFTPRFIDKITYLVDCNIPFELIEKEYYKIKEEGHCAIIKFNEKLNELGCAVKVR